MSALVRVSEYSLEEVIPTEELPIPGETLFGEVASAFAALDALCVPGPVQHVEQEPVQDGPVAARTLHHLHGAGPFVDSSCAAPHRAVTRSAASASRLEALFRTAPQEIPRQVSFTHTPAASTRQAGSIQSARPRTLQPRNKSAPPPIAAVTTNQLGQNSASNNDTHPEARNHARCAPDCDCRRTRHIFRGGGVCARYGEGRHALRWAEPARTVRQWRRRCPGDVHALFRFIFSCRV